MDFTANTTIPKIVKPDWRTPLWPNNRASHALNGDYWQSLTAVEFTFGYNNCFKAMLPQGYLLDINKLPLTLRLFVKPWHRNGRSLALFQYLREGGPVNGGGSRLRRYEINAAFMDMIEQHDATPKWQRRLMMFQMFCLSFRRHYDIQTDPTKLFLEIEFEESQRKKTGLVK